jgi:hypothetical protein
LHYNTLTYQSIKIPLKPIPRPYEPVEGKTYSLFGDSQSAQGYYQSIGLIADKVMEQWGDAEFIVKTIHSASPKKRYLKKLLNSREESGLISNLVHLLNDALDEYTRNVPDHLKNLPVLKTWNKTIGTTREQYHLYMLEIELTNRPHRDLFILADIKIALLPHCLKDFTVECKSAPDNFDYQCRQCSKICYENHISRLLKENQVESYLWMGASIAGKAKEVYRAHKVLGILGIACIPELVAGMRKCRKYGIPVIGLPLDANRCRRWMGDFYPNSINLGQLEALVRSVK